MTDSEGVAAADEEPVTAEDLADIATRLTAMESRLASAEQTVAAEKARHGLAARLHDLFTETSAETALSNATATVDKLKGVAASRVARWLMQRPAILAREAEGPGGPVGRYLDLAERHRELHTWQTLAADAIATMESAAHRYGRAADVELADAAVRWPMASVASLGVSMGARSALDEAQAAIARLRAALPAHGVSVKLEAVDDSFDTFVDLLYKPAFDVLSWNNLSRMEQVVQKLEVTARMLTPLSIYLRQLAERAQAEASEHAAAAQATIASYSQAAYDELPERLRPFSAGRE